MYLLTEKPKTMTQFNKIHYYFLTKLWFKFLTFVCVIKARTRCSAFIRSLFAPISLTNSFYITIFLPMFHGCP